MSGNQSSLPARRIAVRVQPARQERHVGERPAAAHGGDRRRPLHRPIDVHGGDQPRSGDHVLPDRLTDRGAAEPRIVDSLRPRQRQRRPAGVCRPHHARQSGSTALFAALGQRISSGPAPGRAVPQRQGCRPVPREPGWRHAREPAALARSPARSPGACVRGRRRYGSRRAHRAVRDVVPHAGERARGDGRLG